MLPNPVYNFSAGPAVLPDAVLHTAQNEMLDYNGTGFPVMSMSHRSDVFMSILHHAEQDLRTLLDIPDKKRWALYSPMSDTRLKILCKTKEQS